MESLSLKFAQERMVRGINDCTNVEELKQLTKMLVQSFYMNQQFIADLLKEKLPKRKSASGVATRAWCASDALLFLL
jgi:hypothetical protein